MKNNALYAIIHYHINSILKINAWVDPMNHNNLSREKMLAGEPMFPLIFKMSIPTVAAQLVNLLYSIVDRIFIGHMEGVGKDALAGVGLTSSIIILIAAFAGIVSGGGTPLASMALGENDKEKAEKTVSNGFLMLLFFSLFTMTAAYIFKAPVLRMIGASDTLFPYANEYLSVYLAGTVFVHISTGMVNFITAQGRSTVSMLCTFAGAFLNIALDPIFIFVFGLGVRGAALATIISQFVSAVIILMFLVSKKASVRLNFRFMRPDFPIILQITKLGVSSFVMVATESFIGFVLNGNLQKYGGDIYISALTVFQSAMQIMTIPITGFCTGVTPIISYNYGAGNMKRVRQCFARTVSVTFTFMLLGAFFMIFFPRTVSTIFTTDEALLEICERYMPVFFAGITIFGLQRACQSTFVALGQPVTPLIIAVLRKVVLLIPLAVFLPMISSLGVGGVYLAEPIADALSATICTTVFVLRFGKILSKREKELAGHSVASAH